MSTHGQGPVPIGSGQPVDGTGRRFAATIIWALIAVGGLASGLSGSGVGVFVVGLGAAAYVVYLIRGGSVVVVPLPVWLWLPLAGLRKLWRRS